MPDAHAYLSASSAARWINCPPSVQLEQRYGQDSGSTFAEEGTAAHKLAELRLKKESGQIDGQTLSKEEAALNTQYGAYVNAEMSDYIDAYTAQVMAYYAEARKESSNRAVILLEQRLDYDRWAKEGFGTGDVVILTPERINVIDLKYGKGVAVSAEENPQLKLYGLGAIQTYGDFFDFRTVKTTIIQPRLDSVSEAEYFVLELTAWGETVVKPAAEEAYKGKGTYRAGEHCRWCKAKAVCRARSSAALDFIEPYLERKPEALNDEELARVYLKMDGIREYLTDLEKYALSEALNGHAYPGLKLVEGRANRKYSDDAAVAEKLVKHGYPEEIIYERKLLTITALEKALGAKKVKELLEADGLIVKPSGKPVLVSVSDKRPEMGGAESAKKDFADTNDQ